MTDPLISAILIDNSKYSYDKEEYIPFDIAERRWPVKIFIERVWK